MSENALFFFALFAGLLTGGMVGFALGVDWCRQQPSRAEP